MRLLLFLTISLMEPLVGCASLGGSGAGGSDGQPSGLTVACTNDRAPEVVALLDWELTVSPSSDPIRSGERFTVTLDGAVVFSKAFVDAAQGLLPQGWQESNLVDLKATVRVRSGASGVDVTLEPESLPYRCDEDGKACDPENDVRDDPPKPPGLRGNTDCEPVGAINPCGRFIFVPTSTDCGPNGECARLGKIEQCIVHDFCVTGGLRIELQAVEAQYTADVQGEKVLFGWDDGSTGATIQEGGNNDGTWILPPAVYEKPTGSIGLRMTVDGVPAAFECTMGVDSQGDLGVGSLDALSSRTPDSELIAVPIQTR